MFLVAGVFSAYASKSWIGMRNHSKDWDTGHCPCPSFVSPINTVLAIIMKLIFALNINLPEA